MNNTNQFIFIHFNKIYSQNNPLNFFIIDQGKKIYFLDGVIKIMTHFKKFLALYLHLFDALLIITFLG